MMEGLQTAPWLVRRLAQALNDRALIGSIAKSAALSETKIGLR